jgi:putative NIF3 family GTP cyclohydrolase 1 type 2
MKRNTFSTRRNGTARLREAFDNVGLLLGDQNEEATGVLVCHDALENVINEAITKNV